MVARRPCNPLRQWTHAHLTRIDNALSNPDVFSKPTFPRTTYMRVRVARSLLIAAVLAAMHAASASGQGVAGVDTLRWMSGCWTTSRGTVVTDEMWMVPRGGVMLGVARTVNGTQLREAEFTRIFARGDTLVYAASPSNQASAEFSARRATHTEIVFENLAHDYPKRIVYRAVPPDSLHAYVEGAAEGERRIWYRYARADCD
jgi:hypothetical protein